MVESLSFEQFVNFAWRLRVDESEGLRLLEVRAVVEEFCLVVPGVDREWYSRVCGLWRELSKCEVEGDSWDVYRQLWTEYGVYLTRMLCHCRKFSARSVKSPRDRPEERWDLDALGYRLCVACCSCVRQGSPMSGFGGSFRDHFMRLDGMREALDVHRLLGWYVDVVYRCYEECMWGGLRVDEVEALRVSKFRETCCGAKDLA